MLAAQATGNAQVPRVEFTPTELVNIFNREFLCAYIYCSLISLIIFLIIEVVILGETVILITSSRVKNHYEDPRQWKIILLKVSKSGPRIW